MSSSTPFRPNPERNNNQPAGVKRKYGEMICASDRVEEMTKDLKSVEDAVGSVGEIARSFMNAVEGCDNDELNTDPVVGAIGASNPAEGTTAIGGYEDKDDNATSGSFYPGIVVEISDAETDNEENDDKENRDPAGPTRLPFDRVREAAVSTDNDDEDKENIDPAFIPRLPFEPIYHLNVLTQGIGEDQEDEVHEDAGSAASSSHHVAHGVKANARYPLRDLIEAFEFENQELSEAPGPDPFIYMSSDAENTSNKEVLKTIHNGSKLKVYDILVELTEAIESENEDTSEAPVPDPFVYISNSESIVKEDFALSPDYAPSSIPSSPQTFPTDAEMDGNTKLLLAALQLEINTIDVFPRMVYAVTDIIDEVKGPKTPEPAEKLARLRLKLNPSSRPRARSYSFSSDSTEDADDSGIADLGRRIAKAEKTADRKANLPSKKDRKRASKAAKLSRQEKLDRLAAMPDLLPQVEAITNNAPLELTRAQTDRAVKATNECIESLGLSKFDDVLTADAQATPDASNEFHFSSLAASYPPEPPTSSTFHTPPPTTTRADISWMMTDMWTCVRSIPRHYTPNPDGL
ncbi:hypothetical protein BDW74DRAFT_176589 [Aspergillus multicolor]|uniref:uncharacterized protein n=1 Tax=Aspergillus multicolor TaxID=41759 RepID=UPI003CCCAFBE